MLIVVEPAASAAVTNALGSPYARIALSRALQAYLDGLHVLVLPPSLCQVIESDTAFSADERAASKKIRQKYAEHGGLAKQVAVFGRLIDSATQLAPVRVGLSWDIPLRWLAGQPLYETQLVAEDLNDVGVLTGAAEDSLNHRRLFAFRVRLAGVAGGGGNSHRVLNQKAIAEQRITIGFTDSDKECPAAPVGPTAAKCQAVGGPGLYDLRLTRGRSLENTLPWRLLDRIRATCNPLPSVALAQLDAVVPDAPRFANLKRGVFGHDIHRLGQAPCAGYWSSTRVALGRPQVPHCCAVGCKADAVGSCSENFVSGYGSSTVADAATWLVSSTGNTSRHRDYFSEPDAAEWRELGQWVAEYGLGMPRRRI